MITASGRSNRKGIGQPFGLPCGSAGKESACSVGDLGLIPGLGRSTGQSKGYPPQCSGLENSVDFIVHRVAKSRTGLSDMASFETALPVVEST